MERKAYGFELKREYVQKFYSEILPCYKPDMFIKQEIDDKKMKQLEMFGQGDKAK